jgi:Carboxypeptidase regulatory-like domain
MKRFAALAFALATVLSFASCNNPNGPPGNYGSISGKITSSSGQPIANVIVVVDNVLDGEPSASDGTYQVHYVPVTDPLSLASAAIPNPPAGYAAPAPQTNITVVAGQTTAGVNFTLTPT